MADQLLQEASDGRLLNEDGSLLLSEPIPVPLRTSKTPRLKFRHGTTQEWATANPVLAPGEPGVDISTGDFKIGDGSTPWLSAPLKYAPPIDVSRLPRGIVAVSDSYNPVAAGSGVDLTPSLGYTFDPTRRYRANYIIRAMSAAMTLQFQLINSLNGAVVASDHIPGSPPATGPGLSGSYFDWLFTASGYMELRVRMTTYFTAGTVYGVGASGFYLEDVGAL